MLKSPNFTRLMLLYTTGASSEGQALKFATVASRISPNYTYKLPTLLVQKVPIVFYTRVVVADVNRQDINRQGFP